jgi:hypothetical protein
MASSINASTTAGVVTTADTSGVLNIQTAGTTAIAISASQAVSFTNAPTVTGGTANGVAYLNGSKVLTTGSALVFDGTNLGVGVSPASDGAIHVHRAGASFPTIKITNGTTGTANLDGFDLICGSGGEAYVYNREAQPLLFGTSNTERARIDSSGNLALGGTTASSVISGTATVFQVTNNNLAAITLNHTSAKKFSISSQTTSSLVFYDETANTERARIDSSGNLLVGTTDANPNSGDGVKMNAGTGARTSIVGAADTNANFAITVYSRSPSAYRFQVGYGGTIYATSTSITAISDASLKTNVRDLETGLTEVMALQPRRFDWINGDASNVAGFIAQEVKQVLPDLVEDYQYSDEETKLGLKMGDILPTLVKAIQEQQALITQLQADVAALKGA